VLALPPEKKRPTKSALPSRRRPNCSKASSWPPGRPRCATSNWVDGGAGNAGRWCWPNPPVPAPLLAARTGIREAIALRLHAAAAHAGQPPLARRARALFPPAPATASRLAEDRLRPRRAPALQHRHRRPGTGKTTTVVQLLAVLQHLALGDGRRRRLRIRLAAPTGKAAARLNESIAGAVQGLPLRGLAESRSAACRDPDRGDTVHRLLGSRPTRATSATTRATRCRSTCWCWTKPRWWTWR
jgi:hypothetical protein